MRELRGALPPGVPQPRRRHRAVQAARPAPRSSASSTFSSTSCASGWPTRGITVDSRPRRARFIADQGYDPVYGARPLRRYISHEVETLVGRALLRGDAGRRHDPVDVVHGEITMVASDSPTEGRAVA